MRSLNFCSSPYLRAVHVNPSNRPFQESVSGVHRDLDLCALMAAQLNAPKGAAPRDLTGKYVMPGLIDLHTHVAGSDGLVQDPKRTFTREKRRA
jgi:cytosine/adenosine deaminase-related metal-dependent hydrolase